ncbi:DNA topoisomerase 3-alpha, partial [Mucuna pruriens]
MRTSLCKLEKPIGVCSLVCSGPVYLIQFKFRQLEIPPNYSANHLGCIGGCDEVLAQLIEICGTGSRMPARTRGPTAPTSNAHHTNPRRQGVCTNCQETGHSTNDCPLRSRNVRHHGMSEHDGEASVSCNSCGTPCVLRTANTANNRGRKFYSCQSQECNFFVLEKQNILHGFKIVVCLYKPYHPYHRWEDSLNDGTEGRSVTRSNSIPASNPRQNGGRGSRGRGGRNGSHTANTTFVSATGDPVSGRRCFMCGDPSHFANGEVIVPEFLNLWNTRSYVNIINFSESFEPTHLI